LPKAFRLQTLPFSFYQAGVAADDAQNVAAALQTWLATDDEHSTAKALPSFCERIQDDVYAIQLVEKRHA